METKNIMIVGVGGQGTLLASKILGEGFRGAWYEPAWRKRCHICKIW